MTRDIALEQSRLKEFGDRYGKMPSTPNEWANFHTMVYGTNLPDEFKGEQTNSNPQVQYDASQPYGGLEYARNQVEQAQQQYGVFNKPQQSLNVLQNAIKAKTGMGQAPIGESSIFQQAGVGGIGALAASLNARKQEIAANRTTFENVIAEAAGAYKEDMENTFNKWQAAREDYQDLVDQIQEKDKLAQQYEQSIKLLNAQSRADKDLAKYKAGLETGKYDYEFYNDMIDNGMSSGIKATADQIANSIRIIESGGNYDAQGASGESGAYQYMPRTWKSYSTEYAKANNLGNGPLEMTPENQDAVTKYKIQQWLDEGLTPEQIASKWNSGSPDWVGKVGTNKSGVSYDVPGYVKKFINNLQSSTGSIDKLSPLAKQFYEGKYVPQTPSQIDKMSQEIADAGLELPAGLEPKMVIKGVMDVVDLLKKVDNKYRGQVQGRVAELSKAEERNKDVQNYKTAASIVGMVLTRMFEKGRISDEDRKFYLGLMPNLRQQDNTIAEESAMELASVIAERFGLNLDEVLNESIKFKDPKTGETKEFTGLSQSDIQEALDKGYTLVE